MGCSAEYFNIHKDYFPKKSLRIIAEVGFVETQYFLFYLNEIFLTITTLQVQMSKFLEPHLSKNAQFSKRELHIYRLKIALSLLF